MLCTVINFLINKWLRLLLGEDLPFRYIYPLCCHPGETFNGYLGLGECIWTVWKSWAWLAAPNAVGIPCLERLLADGRALRLTCSPVLLSLHLCCAQAVIQLRRRAGAFLVTARALFRFPILSSNSVKRTVWVLQNSCCRGYRIIPSLLSSETDFLLKCMWKWSVSSEDCFFRIMTVSTSQMLSRRHWCSFETLKTIRIEKPCILWIEKRHFLFSSVVQHRESYENHLDKKNLLM